VSIAAQLQAALHRLLANEESLSDRQLIQAGLLNGDVAFSESDRNVVVGGDASGVVVSGNNNRIVVHLVEASYQTVREKLFPAPAGVPTPIPSLLFLGRDRDLFAIKTLILLPKTGTASPIVIVEGWPGVGKTSFAHVLGRDHDVMTTYSDGVLWTSLGQSPNLFSALSTWGRALGCDDLLSVPTLNELTSRLRVLLSSRRMLLIVDDVWDIGSAMLFLRACPDGCGVLFTTRETQVAVGFTHTAVRHYRLPVLGENDALGLLRALVPEILAENEEICRSLARDLGYLPLALHVAGRLLRSEVRLGWGVEQLLEDVRSGAAIIREQAPEDRAEEGELPTVKALLQKSTDLLDPRTRDYFAYLGVFAPKPATFDLDALGAVWGDQDPKPYVRRLVNHGLLEPIGNGRFQMHALLMAHAKGLLDDNTATK
jgi:hypothetical protein